MCYIIFSFEKYTIKNLKNRFKGISAFYFSHSFEDSESCSGVSVSFVGVSADDDDDEDVVDVGWKDAVFSGILFVCSSLTSINEVILCFWWWKKLILLLCVTGSDPKQWPSIFNGRRRVSIKI